MIVCRSIKLHAEDDKESELPDVLIVADGPKSPDDVGTVRTLIPTSLRYSVAPPSTGPQALLALFTPSLKS